MIFGSVAICAASSFLLFLPETVNKELPQTLEEGEKYGINDTAFNFTCCKNSKNVELESNVNEKMLA